MNQENSKYVRNVIDELRGDRGSQIGNKEQVPLLRVWEQLNPSA